MNYLKNSYVFLSVSRKAMKRHPECHRLTRRFGTPYDLGDSDYSPQFAGWNKAESRAFIASPFYKWPEIACDLQRKTGEKPHAQFSLSREPSADAAEALQKTLLFRSQFDAYHIERRMVVQLNPAGPPEISLR